MAIQKSYSRLLDLLSHQINLTRSIVTHLLQSAVFLLQTINFAEYRRQVQCLDSQLFLLSRQINICQAKWKMSKYSFNTEVLQSTDEVSRTDRLPNTYS